MAALLLGLLLLPVAALPGLLLPVPPPPSPEVVGADVDLYPAFPVAPELLVVNASPAALDPGEIIALTTLQGIVNRAAVRLYLDPGGQWGNASSLLSFVVARHGLAARPIAASEAFARFAAETRGVVVYDPARPATVNLATTYAGLDDLVAADPPMANLLARRFALPVVLDLRAPPWSSLGDDASVVRFALRELYPRVDHRRLFIVRPDHFGLRDYAVATRSFVFYVPQGPLATPWSVALTEEVLAAFPQGIPVFGWFQTPTRAEENFFVQRSSRYGKVVLGGEDLMDLTVLTSLGRGQRFRLAPEPSGLPLEDRVYIAFAVPDGDNLDFLPGRMAKMWRDPGRGRLPLAWSLSPLFQEVAPPLVEYYEATRSPLDAFVAAPSGAGYLYPGFTPPAALAAHLARTARAMEASGMEEVWLLNSFTAYEPPYPEEVLRAYVAAVGPRALLLDYGDMATTRDHWMVEGGGRASAVLRTVHLWGTRANFEAKVAAQVDALGSGPQFIFAALYPWRFAPRDALAVLDALRTRYGDRIVAVSVADLVDLLERAYLLEARARARAPLPGLPWADADAARSYADLADEAAARGNMPRAAYYGYAALEAEASSMAPYYLAALGVAAAVPLGLLALLPRRPRGRPGGPSSVAAFALTTWALLVGTGALLRANFWDYYPLGLGAGAAALALRACGRLQPLAARAGGGLLATAGLALLPLTPLAFLSLVAGASLLLAAHLRAKASLVADLVLGGYLGGWASLLPLPYFPALAPLFPALAALLPPGGPLLAPAAPLATARRGPYLSAIAALGALPVALLPLGGLHFLYLRLGPLASPTDALDLLLPGLALALALGLLRTPGLLRRRGLVGAAAALPLAALLLYVAPGPLPTAAAALALLALVALLPLALALRLPPRGRPPTEALALRWPAFALLAALLSTLPGITYSLYIVPLPWAAEYLLYASPLLLAALGMGLLPLIAHALGRPAPGR